MTSSELSNALNPHAVAQRHRRRNAVQNSPITAPIPVTTSVVAPQALLQPNVPHRSELELAILVPPPPPPTQIVPAIPQEPAPRNVPPLVQELYKIMATAAKDATVAERRRRLAWEQEQQAITTQTQAEMERRILDMQQELSLLKAYISMHPTMAPNTEMQIQGFVENIPTSAHIEPLSPAPESSLQSMSPYPVPHNSTTHYPLFVEGSSSRPLSAPQTLTPGPQSPSTLYTLSPAETPGLLLDNTEVIPSPQPSGPAPATAPSSPGPERLKPSRKRPRHVWEDDSDPDSESEKSDSPLPDHPTKRKNGHDGRCLTVHHAIRIHIRKLMQLEHGEALPDGPFDGVTIGEDDPVRFVWDRTTKQSSTNASMKKRVLSSLKANRNKYKRVPDQDFAKKNLEAAFEQVYTTLRQKYKAQKDATAATKMKRREDHKALKARRLHRKKTKLTNRTEARKKLDAFSQPIFDGALQQECMSSEESDGDYAKASGDSVQVFHTHGLPWRSSRLMRFYGILDEHDKFQKSMLPKRGHGRRERREGVPKDGLFLPPKGVARWMVSRRWLEETMAMRPDLADILGDLIVERTEPEPERAHLMLGPETSEDEMDHTSPGANVYAHVSDTSYSLHNALQPIC